MSASALLVVALAIAAIGAVVALSARLRAARARDSRYWELSSDLLCTAGFDGYFTSLNPAWETVLGWRREDLCARPFIEFVHPADRVATSIEAERLVGGSHETVHFHNRYRCRDGTYRKLLWSAKAVPDERRIYASARDVTETEQAHEDLRRSQHFLESVLENLPQMVVVKDAEQLRFVRLNRAGETLLGTGREAVLGHTDADLFPTEDAARMAADDRRALATAGVVDLPAETLDTPAGTRIVHMRKIALRDDDGEPHHVLGIADDITERCRAEREAAAAHEEVERANQAKNVFLSRMSHELRTPLNAILGFAQLLELDELDDRQEESVDQILKAGRHLLELINEVLDIARIEAGTMTLSLEPVRVGDVVEEALALIRPLADGGGVRLHVAAPAAGRPGLHATADKQRLKQVLINLLSNAVKYNRAGGDVTVDWATRADGRVEIAVGDSGHGMTDEQLARIFEPFERLGAQTTGIEGTGLGLPLSLGLAEAMGGELTARSEPGRGTTMCVVLDAAAHDLDPAPRRPTQNGARLSSAARTIVYIEDNLANLKLVEQLVARLPDVRLIPIMTGGVAIDLVREHRPDLVLLDLHLPGRTGLQVLDALKSDPETTAIPVVVLSADATPEQITRLRAAGAAAYLTKPIDVESLLATVRDTPRGSKI